MNTEITFYRPLGPQGRALANLLSEADILVTTIYKESDSAPRLFVEGTGTSYRGAHNILNFLSSLKQK